MFPVNYEAELLYCLAEAAKLLDGPAQPLCLEWELEQLLEGLLKLEVRRGLGHEPPVLCLQRGKRGHCLTVGMERLRWDTPEGSVCLVKIVVPVRKGELGDFWAVRTVDYRRFYRFVRRELRKQEIESPPLLDASDQRRLWENTIGFLRRGQAEMAKYGVWPKRGVLLLGEPGNGKTMACRWLAAEARRHGLEWKSVTAECYESAKAEREVPALFRLPSPGFVLFDDLDAGLLDRHKHGESDKRATFLAELDGVEQKTGIVYLFTTNASFHDLDPAARRPGRIDVIVHFSKPNALLRRRLITERWHPDLLSGIDAEEIADETDGFSFAEMDEVKKLLVMRHVETGRWNWPWVRAALGRRGRDQWAAPAIGFHDRSACCQPIAR